MKKKATALLLAGLLLVFLILYAVDFDEFKYEVGKLSIEYFLILMGIQLFSIFFAALKWRVILRHSPVRLKNLIPATFVGYFINGITPIGLAGGEPVKAYIISQTDDIPFTTAASSVIVDLFIEVIPMFVFCAISIYIVFTAGVSPELGFALGIIGFVLFLAFILAVALVSNKTMSHRIAMNLLHASARIGFIRKRIEHLIPELDEISDRFNKAIRLHMLDNTILVFATLLSFAVWSLRFLRTYLIFYALGFEVEYSTVLIVETAVSVLSFLPLLPGSLGIWEGASTALYVLMTPFGGAASAAVTIINRFYLFLVPLIIGFFAAVYLGLNITAITESNHERWEKK